MEGKIQQGTHMDGNRNGDGPVRLNEAGDWDGALRRARTFSPFLRLCLDRDPEMAALLACGDADGALAMAARIGDHERDIARSLRLEKRAFATALAIGDLAGALPLQQVMTALSSLADRTLDRAIRHVIARRVDGAGADGFIALALGKHGAQELNYSSDIDPILLYDRDVLARRDRDEPGEAAQRYAREIVQLMSAVTADGYVFRVDLRLRPASEISPLAVPVGAALTHYESSALAWERAAFIRARTAAGDCASGEDFLTAIRPFIWRRSLDFGAIQEISRLTQRIRATYDGPTQVGPNFNLKQGRGGIREVEFFAQTHQLIHGGRDPSLRVRGTRDALNALASAGIISADDARIMGASYDGLRMMEHRLQMVDDRQTHTIPDGEGLEMVAGLAGFDNSAAFLAHIAALTAPVAERFDRLIAPEQPGASAAVSVRSLADDLAQLGFENAPDIATRVQRWSDGRYQCLRSPAAISAFEAIRPTLLEHLGAAPNREEALSRWEELLQNAASAVNLFRLIEARPGLLEQLVRILVFAPPLAQKLGRRPHLLDILFDRSAMALPGTVAELQDLIEAGPDPDDYERRLDRIRVVTGETRFALGVQMLTAERDPLEIGAALARLAEAGLRSGARAAEYEYQKAHGRFSDNELAIIGLGRFGGGMLTHASDLDIIYVHSGGVDGESTGPRSASPTLYFNRLAQRVSAALSVATAEGALYEIDTRLRPQGAQGPLVVSFDAFARYQREDAWTWEHMALTRARVVYGSPAAQAALEALIAQILTAERDPITLHRDVLHMRGEMARHKTPKGPLDVKLMRGGLVDLEFIVHFLQLRETCGFDPNLANAIAQLIDKGLLSENILPACRVLTRVLIAARLIAPELVAQSPSADALLAQICGKASFAELNFAIKEAREHIAAQWHAVFDTKLEINA